MKMRETSRDRDKKLYDNNKSNKGCVSLILPDDQMPENEYGERADIICNPLGVISRLNIAQNYEQELNYVADNVVRYIKAEETNEGKFNKLYEFLNMVNEPYAEFIKNNYPIDKEEQDNYFNEIYEKGIFIHQPPFFGNVDFGKMADILKYYNLDGYRINTKINGQETTRKLVMGNMYFMRLKHDPIGKLSVRSSSYVNINNIPSKSLSYKEHQNLYSQTPIRLGEMEFTNLLLTQDMKSERKFYNQYSIAPDERQNMIETILNGDVLDLGDIEELPNKTESVVSKINKTYFEALGLKITFNEEDNDFDVTDVDNNDEE